MPLDIITLKLNSWLKNGGEWRNQECDVWLVLFDVNLHDKGPEFRDGFWEPENHSDRHFVWERKCVGGVIGFDTTLRNRTLHKGISSTNLLWNIPEHSLLLSLDSDMIINQTFRFKVNYRIYHTGLFKSTYRKKSNFPWGIIHSKCNFIITFTSSCGGVDRKTFTESLNISLVLTCHMSSEGIKYSMQLFFFFNTKLGYFFQHLCCTDTVKT